MDFTKAKIISVLQNPLGKTFVKTHFWSNSQLIYKMLQALYKRQTSFEQEAKCTVEDNGIGFNGFDSGFLSDVAERSQAYRNLSDKQTIAVAKRLIKYAGQLEAIALEKVQQSLLVCGYCSETGHTQQDCIKYKEIEMGQKQLFEVGKYPD